ncbi:MAG: hypothetical protein LLG40_10340 [Deltaproteobacteria bacterium]|nr:hypothetical protein [Deltaproteobacteria bacterium]
MEYKKFDAMFLSPYFFLLHVYILLNMTGSIGIADYFVNELNPGELNPGICMAWKQNGGAFANENVSEINLHAFEISCLPDVKAIADICMGDVRLFGIAVYDERRMQ